MFVYKLKIILPIASAFLSAASPVSYFRTFGGITIPVVRAANDSFPIVPGDNGSCQEIMQMCASNIGNNAITIVGEGM
jgi:hypothetical protein